MKKIIWTDEMIDMLKQLYKKGLTYNQIADKMGLKYGSIKRKAQEIKLFNKNWTKDEEDILKKYYTTTQMEDLLKLLPNRTQSGILMRASKLNLGKLKLWTKEEKELLKLYYPYESNEFLENLFGVKYDTIKCAAKKLKLKKDFWWSEEEENLLREKWKTCKREELKEYFPNRNLEQIIYKAEAMRLIKNRGSWNHYINENFFNPLTPESAYILGYIYSDGCVYGRHFSISSVDYEILEKIKNSMQSDHKISKVNNTSGFGIGHIYTLNIGSVKMVNDLRNLGLFENKSLKIELPKIPDELMPHFIRGYFDGDGSVYVKSNKTAFTTCFTSGSKLFLEQLREYLINKLDLSFTNIYSYNGKNCGDLRFSKKDSTTLFHYIYKDATIYLQRKYDRFIQYGCPDILNQNTPTENVGCF